ncbi:MAG: hypothetical protein ACFHVJ_18995 [Aestuariibacter sp.]
MNKRLIKCILLLSMLVYVRAAFSGEAPEYTAQEALKLALLDAQNRDQQLTEHTSLGFIETLSDGNGNQLTRSFIPTGDNGAGDWQVLQQHGENVFTGPIEWNMDIKLDCQALSKMSLSLARESETFWFFNLEGGVTAKAALNNENSQLSLGDKLVTHLLVAKSKPMIQGLQIFSKGVFKPNSLTRVDRFQVTIDYAPAWQGGPLAVTSMERMLTGSYGWLFSVDEHIRRKLSDFKMYNF